MTEQFNDNIETGELSRYVDESYLNYSMYVIMNRALPHLADGLKPVQRRLLYAMIELRLTALAKHKKSARTVGDTLGKFHPHGDTACYEAMVNMAQPFSTLHPLVDGQGNWGSIDEPKSFAAMRYTESKLTAYAETLLQEIRQDTVDWLPNFDGTLQEPALLPAQLPNILINGATGIAVGLATDIPPHNLREVVNACIATLHKKNITDDEILSYITMPDFPSGCEIISPMDDIRKAYLTGNGNITVRASIETVGDVVYITSVPYRVPFSRVITLIDEQIKKEKLPVDSMRDKSDKNHPVRLALTIKGEAKQKMVLARLFATTPLESGCKINMNMIGIDGRPEVKSLPTIVREWCAFRQSVFERKKRFRLRAVEARLHILDGLLIAYSQLDDVIRIVRESDDPKSALITELSLSETQAQAILELRLRQLARLEEGTLKNEHEALSTERSEMIALLADTKKIRQEMILELKNAAQQHISPRRTVHKLPDSTEISVEATPVTQEPMTVVMSEGRWLRALKGHELDLSKLPYKAGDAYAQHCETQSHANVLMMADKGRFFGVPVEGLPNGKSMGEPVTTKIQLQDGERVQCLLPYRPGATLLFCTAKGSGGLTPMDNLDAKVKKGKHVIVVTKGDHILPPVVLAKETLLALATKAGRFMVIPIDSLNTSNKSQGTRLIDIKPNEYAAEEDAVLFAIPFSEGDTLVVHVGQRKLLMTPEKLQKYYAQRARRGIFFESGRNIASVTKQ